jgi:glucosamine--fructose-6-phosphate aminotransferase (isomerizing)
VEIDLKINQAEKGDYPHFMIKEIMEQKESIRRAIEQDDQEILKIAEAIKGAFGTYLVGCGTAGKVCLAATYLFSHIAKRHVNFAVGSEFSSLQDFIKDKLFDYCRFTKWRNSRHFRSNTFCQTKRCSSFIHN